MKGIKQLSKAHVEVTREVLKNLNKDGRCTNFKCDECGLGCNNSINGHTNCELNCNLTYKLKDLLSEYDDIKTEENESTQEDAYIIASADRTNFITKNGSRTNIYRCNINDILYNKIKEMDMISFDESFNIMSVNKESFKKWCDIQKKLKELENKTFTKSKELEYVVISRDGKYLSTKGGSIIGIKEVLMKFEPDNFIFKKTTADRIKAENGGVLQAVNRVKIEKAIKKNNSAVDSFVKLLGGIK